MANGDCFGDAQDIQMDSWRLGLKKAKGEGLPDSKHSPIFPCSQAGSLAHTTTPVEAFLEGGVVFGDREAAGKIPVGHLGRPVSTVRRGGKEE